MKLISYCLALFLLLGCSALPNSQKQKVERIEVYLLGGQSNADGHGHTNELSAAQVKPDPNVLFYHGNGGNRSPLKANAWLPLQPGSGSKKKNSGGFGPELGFGKALHRARGSETTKVAVIKYAVGGSNLAIQWRANGKVTKKGDGPFYQKFQQTVSQGIAELKELYPSAQIEIVGMLWHQGESDMKLDRANKYQANLLRLSKDLRANYGAELILLIGQLSTDQYPKPKAGFPIIAQAQRSVANSSDLTALVPSQGLPVDLPGNRIHFGTEGQLKLGERYGLEMVKLLTSRGQ